MKRELFHLSLLCVLVLPGATVPQKTAGDYYFSRPNLPSNIVGRVMGSPPAYHAMRSEDIAWLREAYAERAALASQSYRTNNLDPVVALAPSYGKWPLSRTNRFVRWTTATERQGAGLATNVIVGYSYVTNWGTGVDSARIKPVTLWYSAWILGNTNHNEYSYLAPDNGAYELADQAWEYKADEYGYKAPDFGARAVTNIAEVEVVCPAWSNCQSVITMQLTNGTTSVYTNAWRVFAPTNAKVTATNIWPRHAGLASHIFTNGVVAGYGRAAPGDLRGPFDSRAITNHYEFLRGMRRLARLPSWTNSTLAVQTHYTDYSSDAGKETADYTNGTAVLPFVEYRASRGEGRRYVWKEGETYQDEGTWEVENWDNYSTYRASTKGTQRYFVPGGIAMIPGGQLTVRATTLFAEARVEYSESYSATGKDIDLGSGTNRIWYVVLPAGAVSLDHDETRVWFDTSLGGLPERATGAAGAPALPGGDSLPGYKYSLPEPWHGDDPYHRETVDASRGATSHWKAEVTGLLLLLDFAPLASLDGWND